MSKYLKVMFNTSSKAGNGFEYKIGEVNVANYWNPTENDPAKTGGFNFSCENKILRWLVRGDTLYDVSIPDDAEMVEIDSPSCPHGVFRTNKIILSNPRLVTDDVAMDLYLKAELPEESFFKALAGCALRGHINTARRIIKDKVNKDNIIDVVNVFEDFCHADGEEFDESKLEKATLDVYHELLELKKELV